MALSKIQVMGLLAEKYSKEEPMYYHPEERLALLTLRILSEFFMSNTDADTGNVSVEDEMFTVMKHLVSKVSIRDNGKLIVWIATGKEPNFKDYQWD